MHTRLEYGLRIGNLTVRLVRARNAKLIVSRNDRRELPHLTITWQNASGEIDIHLTTRSEGGLESHQSIAKIPESCFREACKALSLEFLKTFEAYFATVPAPKIRPGWLARKGYVVLYQPQEVQEQLLEKLIPTRRHHGKSTRVLDRSVLEAMNRSPEVTSHVYHPAVLHVLAPERPENLICAECVRGKRKGHVMLLRLVTTQAEKPYWVRFDRVAKKALTASNALMRDFVKRVLPHDVWAIVHRELHLNEVNFEM
jgi:hypothetical protein